jgi:hypothetical protein
LERLQRKDVSVVAAFPKAIEQRNTMSPENIIMKHDENFSNSPVRTRSRSRTIGDCSIALLPQQVMSQLSPQLAIRRSNEIEKDNSQTKQEKQEKPLSPKRRLTDISNSQDIIYSEAKKSRLSDVEISSAIFPNLADSPNPQRMQQLKGVRMQQPSSPILMKQVNNNSALSPTSPT